MNYKYPTYAPWYEFEFGKKSWGNTLINLFQMINVKDNGDDSFTIDWDENDPQESIFNDWTKEDFTEFFKWAAERELDLGKNTKELRAESKESYYNSESEGKEINDHIEEEFFIDQTAEEVLEDILNVEKFTNQGTELKED